MAWNIKFLFFVFFILKPDETTFSLIVRQNNF
jgi:hypothetical protein